MLVSLRIHELLAFLIWKGGNREVKQKIVEDTTKTRRPLFEMEGRYFLFNCILKLPSPIRKFSGHLSRNA